MCDIPNIFYHNRVANDLYSSLDFVFAEWVKAEQHKSILESEMFDRNLALLRLSLEKRKIDVLQEIRDNLKTFLENPQ